MIGSVTDVLARQAQHALVVGDCLEGLRELPDGCVQTCVTSPPYFGLRDYGDTKQIGLETNPHAYVARLLEVFREVWRVLADDGTLWLNLGDSYACSATGSLGHKITLGGGQANQAAGLTRPAKVAWRNGSARADGIVRSDGQSRRNRNGTTVDGTSAKNMIGIPWRVAFALQDVGWYLRSDIIWQKLAPMPESVTDRPTKAHEYVFLLSKNRRYLYNRNAIREPCTADMQRRASMGYGRGPGGKLDASRQGGATIRGEAARHIDTSNGRNARSVWTLGPEFYDGAHFATMPTELARRCILAGSRKGDVVLDPFGGSGTTSLVALGNHRRAIAHELNPAYAELARQRIATLDADASVPIRAPDADFGPLFAEKL